MTVAITLLGTGSPLPSADRAGPATLVRAGDAVLVDCGRSVVMRLAAAGVSPVGLSAVLLTHLHSDHITDLNGYRIEHEGTAAAIAGDTVPCAGLDELCAGADLYVQTVIRDDLVRAVPSRRLQDILDYHSTVEQAAQTAARAGVRTLVLTHYVPPMAPGQEDEWRAIAAAHFTGEIVLGDDLTTADSKRADTSGPRAV